MSEESSSRKYKEAVAARVAAVAMFFSVLACATALTFLKLMPADVWQTAVVGSLMATLAALFGVGIGYGALNVAQKKLVPPTDGGSP